MLQLCEGEFVVFPECLHIHLNVGLSGGLCDDVQTNPFLFVWVFGVCMCVSELGGGGLSGESP